MENSDFVYARAVFEDKTKAGGLKLTLILGVEDVKQLLAKIEAAKTGEGVKIQAFVSERDGKKRGSMLISDPAKKGGGAGKAASTFAPKKTFAYKPKTIG